MNADIKDIEQHDSNLIAFCIWELSYNEYAKCLLRFARTFGDFKLCAKAKLMAASDKSISEEEC